MEELTSIDDVSPAQSQLLEFEAILVQNNRILQFRYMILFRG